MFIAVFFGYLIAALFSFCGLAGMSAAFQSFTPETDYAVFLATLAQQGWPLAAGIAIFLLVQIAVQLEKTAVFSRYAMGLDVELNHPQPIAARHQPHKKAQAEPAAAPQFFHMEAQAPAEPSAPASQDPTEPLEDKKQEQTKGLNFFKIN